MAHFDNNLMKIFMENVMYNLNALQQMHEERLRLSNMKGYMFIRRIGSGGFASVYLVKKDGQQFADKRMDVSTNEKMELGRCEISVVKDLDHNNIVRFLDSSHSTPDNVLHMLFEYMEGGNLWDMIASGLTVKSAVNLLSQLLSGVEYIHGHGIIHRDLNPENLVLSKNKRILKICDFGIAIMFDQNNPVSNQDGSPAYLGPEVIKGEVSCYSRDIWATGVIVWEMTTRKHPFGFQRSGLFNLALFNDRVLHSNVIPGVSSLNKPLTDLICEMLNKDPKKRPTCKELVHKMKDIRRTQKRATKEQKGMRRQRKEERPPVIHDQCDEG